MKKVNKKILSMLLVVVLLISTCAIGFTGSAAIGKIGESIAATVTPSYEFPNPYSAKRLYEKPLAEDSGVLSNLTLSQDFFTMTTAGSMTFSSDFDGNQSAFDSYNFNVTIGGVAIASWKGGTSFNGTNYITLSNVAFNAETGKVTGTLTFARPFGSSNLNDITRTLPTRLFGEYDLALVATAKSDSAIQGSASAPFRYTLYDSYHSWDELIPSVQASVAKAKEGRYLEYISLGKSTEGRDLPMGIVAKDKETLDWYLNEFLPMVEKDPDAAKALVESGGDYKIPIWYSNIHSDEQPGIDAMLRMFDEFATKDTFTYQTYSESSKSSSSLTTDRWNNVTGAKTDVSVDIDDLLDNFIFIFNFSINPDGRAMMQRATANGFDPNRDVTFQTHPELVANMREITKWMPASFIEFHGYVANFLIEPCTAPHDPNFEYDLVIDNLQAMAHTMGKAGTATAGLTRYTIPYEDYSGGVQGGWDDASPVYSPIASILFGTLGSTVEIPYMNEASVTACYSVGLSNMKFMLDNKDKVYKSQLAVFKRNLENVDAKEKVDPYFIDGSGTSVGRPRGGNENFFPEYYVIPIDNKLQHGIFDAWNMIEYFKRQSIDVERLTKDVTVNGVTYPAGSFVVDMHQIRRAFINVCLFDGYDVSTFNSLYADISMNFSAHRNFKVDAIRVIGAFDGATEEYASFVRPETVVPEGFSEYVIKNTSNDAVRAVNQLLKGGKTVKLITSSRANVYAPGDFLVSADDIALVTSFQLEVNGAVGNPNAKTIAKPTVSTLSNPSNEVKFMLRELNFDYVASTNTSDFNIIASSVNTNTKSAIDAGIPYIALNSTAVGSLRTNLGIQVTTGGTSVSEALFKATNAQNNFTTANYPQDGYAYLKGTAFNDLPAGVTPLVTLNQDGFICGKVGANRSAFTGKAAVAYTEYQTPSGKAVPITMFAANIVNKGHTKGFYRLFSNAVYAALAGVTQADYNSAEVTPAVTVSSVQKETAFDVTVITSNGVTALSFRNETGNIIGKLNTSFVLNENNDKVWTVSLKLGTEGTGRQITVFTSTGDGNFQNSGKSVTVDITLPAVEILTAVPDTKTALKNTSFTVTVTTSTSVKKLKLMNENGATISSTSACSNDGDTLIWTLTTKVGTAGNNRIISVAAAGKDGIYLDNTKNFTIDITTA